MNNLEFQPAIIFIISFLQYRLMTNVNKFGAVIFSTLLVTAVFAPSVAVADNDREITSVDSVDANQSPPTLNASSLVFRSAADRELRNTSFPGENDRKADLLDDLNRTFRGYVTVNRTNDPPFRTDQQIAAATRGQNREIGVMLATSDGILAKAALQDAQRAVTLLTERNVSFDEATVRREIEAAERAFQQGEQVRQRTPVGAIQHYRRSWEHSQTALDIMDAAVAPQVEIADRSDPIENGTRNYTIQGSVWDIRPYEIETITISINGNRTITTETFERDNSPSGEVGFAETIQLNRTVNTIEVTATDPDTRFASRTTNDTDDGGGPGNPPNGTPGDPPNGTPGDPPNGTPGNPPNGTPGDPPNGTPDMTAHAAMGAITVPVAIHASSSSQDPSRPAIRSRNSSSGSAVLRLDGDGLPDVYERGVTMTDPLDPDSNSSATTANEADNGVIDGREDFDDDLLITLEEFDLGTDPVVPDTDDDDLDDGYEVFVTETNPSNPDTDGDGTPDGEEDPDGDGLTNAAEQDEGTFPTVADTDSDGLNDSTELSLETDPLDPDTDDDGLDDGDELEAPFDTDPLDPDTDDDGVEDGNETYTTTTGNESLGIEVAVTGEGNAADTLRITRPYSGNESRYGEMPIVRIQNRSAFDHAQVTFTLPENMSVETARNVSIVVWEPGTDTGWESVSTTLNIDNWTVSTNRTSFSVFTVQDEEQLDSETVTKEVGWPALETFQSLNNWNQEGNVTAEDGILTVGPGEGSGTLYVAADGSANYTSIQAAINDAIPNERIVIQPGTYTESLVVNKSVELIGSGDDVVLDGSSLDGDADGITVDPGLSLTIENLTIRNYDRGIESVDGGSAPTITATDTSIADNQIGIDAANGGWTLRTVIVSGNTETGVRGGGQWDARNLTVDNNGGAGMDLTGSVAVSESRITNNGDTGLRTGRKSVTITNVTITGNDGDGLVVLGTGGVTVSSVQATENTGDGIQVIALDETQHTYHLDRIEATENGGDGLVTAFFPDTQVDLTLEQADISANEQHGLVAVPFPDDVDWTVTEVRVRNNGQGGIDFVDLPEGNWEMNNVTVVRNDQFGVALTSQGGAAVTMQRVLFEDNSGTGLHLATDTNTFDGTLTIRQSAIVGSSGNGTLADGIGGDVTIRNTTIRDNDAPGVRAVNASRTVDARWNWWGQATGPVPSQWTGDVDIDPYCETSDCAVQPSSLRPIDFPGGVGGPGDGDEPGGGGNTSNVSRATRTYSIPAETEQVTLTAVVRGAADDGRAALTVGDTTTEVTAFSVAEGESEADFQKISVDLRQFTNQTITVEASVEGDATLEVRMIRIKRDSDGDGIPDLVENSDPYEGAMVLNQPIDGLDPQDPDSDDDGLGDGVELKDWNTSINPDSQIVEITIKRVSSNPTVADTDRDGLSDATEENGWKLQVIERDGEVYRWARPHEDSDRTLHLDSDPLMPDTDGDGLSDEVEKYLTHTDPDNNRTYAITADHEDLLRSLLDYDGIDEFQERQRIAKSIGLLRDNLGFNPNNPRLTDATDAFDFQIDDTKTGVDRFYIYDFFGTTTDFWLSNKNETTDIRAPAPGGRLEPRYDYTWTDPWDPDTDGDGLTDGRELNGTTVIIKLQESRTYTTDPQNPDSDDDGLDDLAEFHFQAHPNEANIDGDQFADFHDPDPRVENNPPTINMSYEEGWRKEDFGYRLTDSSGLDALFVSYRYSDLAGRIYWENRSYDLDSQKSAVINDSVGGLDDPFTGKVRVTAVDIHGNAVTYILDDVDKIGEAKPVNASVTYAEDPVKPYKGNLAPVSKAVRGGSKGFSLRPLARGSQFGRAGLAGLLVLGAYIAYEAYDSGETVETAELSITPNAIEERYPEQEEYLPRGFVETQGEFTRGFGWEYIAAKTGLSKSEIREGLDEREGQLGGEEVVEEGPDRKLRFTPINETKWILGILGTAIVSSIGGDGEGEEDDDEDEDGELEVTFIDVGQASSILVQGPKGQNMLIDAGGRKNAGAVREVLDEEDVDVIHHLVVTHNDSDHVNGVRGILSEVPVGVIYVNGVPNTKDPLPNSVKKFKERVNDYPAPVVELRRGNGWMISGAAGFDIDVISPPRNTLLDSGDNNEYNANAIVLRINYQGKSILLPSDIYRSQESQLIGSIRPIDRLIKTVSLNADVQQASHHGTRKGNSLEFLEEVNAARVIIDADTTSRLPNENALNRFGEADLNTYQTGVHGNIKITIDEDGYIYIVTERNGDKTDPDDIKDENDDSEMIEQPSISNPPVEVSPAAVP